MAKHPTIADTPAPTDDQIVGLEVRRFGVLQCLSSRALLMGTADGDQG